MHPEECGKIADKWAPQLAQGRGLVGWLLPKKPTSTKTSVKSASHSTGAIDNDAPGEAIISGRPTLDEIDYLTDLERYR